MMNGIQHSILNGFRQLSNGFGLVPGAGVEPARWFYPSDGF